MDLIEQTGRAIEVLEHGKETIEMLQFIITPKTRCNL